MKTDPDSRGRIASQAARPSLDGFLARLSCPDCRGLLIFMSGNFHCRACGRRFAVPDDQIPRLLARSTDRVRRANEKYHDRIADLYERDVTTTGLFEPAGNCSRRLRSVLKKISSRTRAGNFLDLACGTGHLGSHAAGHFERVVGIDVSISMLRLASAKRIQVCQADAARLPFRDGTFSAVGAFSVLHHLKDPSRVLIEAGRVLKQGGVFFSDWDPNPVCRRSLKVSDGLRRLVKRSRLLFDAAMRMMALVRGRRAAATERRQYASFIEAEYHASSGPGLDPEILSRSLSKAGFKKIKIVYHDNPVSPADPPSVPVLTRFLNLQFRKLSDRESGPFFSILAWK